MQLPIEISYRGVEKSNEIDDLIRTSGLDWTIVRPGLLKNRAATGRYRVLTASKDWQFGAISRSDVADFLVQQINDRTLIGTTPLLIG